ncbi:MAG TPA: DUF397 domain-containing protein [Streptosporangiaceae bacterium]|jgi:hypothetical protein
MDTAGALNWRKSSYSTSNGGDCVEVATTSHMVAVRDSKDPAGAVVTVNLNSWRAFAQDTGSKNYARG